MVVHIVTRSNLNYGYIGKKDINFDEFFFHLMQFSYFIFLILLYFYLILAIIISIF